MNQYPDFDQKLYDDLRRGKEYAFAAVFERYNRLDVYKRQPWHIINLQVLSLYMLHL